MENSSTGQVELQKLVQPLLAWYDENRRILPWRERPEAYRVWVSEIMLQQTRVEAVKPYFDRFLQALPDVKALAEADEEILLKLWEGLGYYNRVRNLQKAARQITERFDGEIPSRYEDLILLCGIGSYTAGAIASIAFGQAVPAVDGNVLRVLARVRCDERMISDGKVKVQVERELEPVIPGDRPGAFNQALMEIGACVCIPNGFPLCGSCPLAPYCMAHREGTECEYPKKNSLKNRLAEKKTVLIIRDADRVVIRKRPAGGLLAGMYEFPSMDGFVSEDEVVERLGELGFKTLRIVALEDAKHIFSHKEWHMKGYMVRVDELQTDVSGRRPDDWILIRPEETEQKYPIPSAFLAYTKLLRMRLGRDRFDSG